MDRARYFVVVLAPHAVASHWVNKEVAHWLQKRGPDRLLFVVADEHVGISAKGPKVAGFFDGDVAHSMTQRRTYVPPTTHRATMLTPHQPTHGVPSTLLRRTTSA